MESYYYYDVRPKGKNQPYYYIFDVKIPTDIPVEIPFGKDNRIIGGMIAGRLKCTEDDVPYPVELTKKIIRPLTKNEYREADGCISPLHGNNYPEIKQAYECWKDDDTEAMFEWACRNEWQHHSDEIMDIVGRFYRRCIEDDIPEAALNLGKMYYNGIYYNADFQKAISLFELDAEKGEVKAIRQLGYCYYDGRYCDADYEKAYHYFHLAAMIYNDVYSQFMLGDMFFCGKHVDKNSKYAITLYYKALDIAKEKNRDCLADIQFRIGKVYLTDSDDFHSALRGLRFLNEALCGFYSRKSFEPEIESKIEETKKLIAKAIERLDNNCTDSNSISFN